MITVRKSKMLTPTSVIPENTYYCEFDCDTIAELPTTTYKGINVAHGSLATIIANGRQYRLNGEGEWCIQRYNASDPILIEKTITENGTYTALDEDVDGYSSVIANVPNTYTESDEGKVVDNGELVAQTARAESITANGTYDTSTNNSVTVDVAGVQFAASPSAFTLLTNIRNLNVEIPSGVTSIGNSAFQGCTGLTSIEIPSGVTSIGGYAFDGCTGLTSIEIPSSVTTISMSAFQGTGLTSVEIPSGVATISRSAFNGCTGLTSIELPSGVTSIGDYAFYGCTGLTSIEIPSSVTTISSNSFANCTNITSIVVHKAEGSISGAPWGATNATVTWTG